MKLFRMMGLGLAGALLASVVAVTSAWAVAPEMGRCVTHAGGKYTNNVCTKVATGKVKGTFEWEPGAIKNKFTGVGGVATLETVKANKVSCKTEASSGEFTSPKTVGNIAVTFTGCESLGFKCVSAGAAEGEVRTNPLAGTLVWEAFSLTTGRGTKVAIDLVPQSGELFVEFQCGPAFVKVKGSVLTNVPVDKALTKLEMKFTAKKGKQKPEYYYITKTEKIQDVLIAKIGATEFEQAGQTITNVQTAEEPLEVNIVA